MKYCLFDLDGTVTDPFLGITGCIAYALEKMGHTPPPLSDLKWCIGPALGPSLGTLLGTDDPEQIKQALAFYRERFAPIGLYENELIAGIIPVLRQLHAVGKTMMLCTAKPHVYAKTILQHFQAEHFFTRIYGSEMDGTRSNKTELMAYLLQAENINPVHAVMIGDRHHDIDAAKAHGVDSIGVLWGYGSHEELSTAGADHIIAHPKQLLDILC